MQFLERVSRHQPGAMTEDAIHELSNSLIDSLSKCNIEEKYLIANLCTQLLNQIERDKAPSFTSIKEAEIALEYFSSNLSRAQKHQPKVHVLPLKPKYYQFETLASCNAGCSFCPYTTMARKGTKMSDETIDYLISQISTRDPSDNFSVCTHKVSEPLLDSRLLNIVVKVLDSHPRVKFGITSNLNFVPNHFWEELLSIYQNYGARISLSVSLNDSDPHRYAMLMRMDQSKTLKNMHDLHEICDKYFELGLSEITVTRTSTQGMHDYEFAKFVNDNFPKFTPGFFKLNSWAEKDNDSINDYTKLIYGDRSCKEWARISINAEGNTSLCCMDSESVKSLGNIYTHTLEQLYLIKCQQFVPSNHKRKDSLNPCANCNYPSQLPFKAIVK